MCLCAVCLDISLLVCLIPGPAPCSALHTWPTWKTSSSVHQHTAQQLNSADLMHFLSHVFVCFCAQLLLVSTISRKEENLIVWLCFSPRVGSLTSSTCCLIHICKGHLEKERKRLWKDCVVSPQWAGSCINIFIDFILSELLSCTYQLIIDKAPANGKDRNTFLLWHEL